jgi:DNA-directed RNA polymerase subunit RPC12/RpoP
MICPHCQFEFETPLANCPECGIRIVRKVSGIVKTSTVMIAAGGEHNFYRSVQEVPESLRQKLIESTNSENSGMIVIADRAGKEQWTEVVAHREAQQARAALETPVSAAEIETPPAPGFAGLSWAAWAGILLFLAACAMIASVFQVFHS